MIFESISYEEEGA